MAKQSSTSAAAGKARNRRNPRAAMAAIESALDRAVAAGAPETAARQFLDAIGPPDLTDLIEAAPSGTWERVLAAFAGRYNMSLPSSTREFARLEKRLEGLPRPLREAFLQWDELRDNEGWIERDAAFAIGLELGRRGGA